MPQSFDQPLVVVTLDERRDGEAGLVERVEPMEPQTLFFQRPDEALDHAIALRFADERWTVGHAEPGQLAAKRVRDILRPPIAPNREAPRDVFAERAEGLPHALVNRF